MLKGHNNTHQSIRRSLIIATLAATISVVPTTGLIHAATAAPQSTSSYTTSLTADFAKRDAMPETNVPRSRWASYGKYGPPAAKFPAPSQPTQYDRVQWQRDRVVTVAQKYLGKVPYKHKHIPMLGLDCSNFTAWVYNYALGIKFTSSVTQQATTVGRKLSHTEPLQPGDLIYFRHSGKITHVGLYIKPGYFIDESKNVRLRKFSPGSSSFAYARRVIE